MAATAMMEEVQREEEEAPPLGAAHSGEAIGGVDVGMDVEQLPQALQQLVGQLREVPPTIQEVDLGGPDQGGDYFRMHPPAPAADAGALWCSVRLWVLELIGRCSSLRVVKLGDCGICSESEVERLCQGLKSNGVLQWLTLDGNVGFGSDFGCGQVSHILANSSTSLETLAMDGVGLEAAGLSQVLSTLLANTASRLQNLDVEHNPECLADERAPQLLAQLVSHPRTSKFLRVLAIRETGLAVPGAALLSAALGAHDGEESTAVQTVQVGGPEPILNVIVSSLGRCSELTLLFCKEEEEAGPLAEPLAQMLRTNTNLRELWLEEGRFSTQAWRCIFRAMVANSRLSCLYLIGSTTLDHSVMDDLHQLLVGNPGLTIRISNAPLKGGSLRFESDFLYCTCSSCASMVTQLALGEGGERNVEQLPKELRPLIAALTAVPPSIEDVDLNAPDHGAVVDMFRLDPLQFGDTSNMLWELRLLVLGLIGRCPSLRAVKLDNCNISKESEVERLCQGLTSNTVLQHLVVNRNLGFGSDFGCHQVSRILASNSTSLQNLHMWAVGMKGTGLSQLLRTLLANKQSQLEELAVGGNPECLANDDDQGSAVQLLAQLLLLPYASLDQPGPTGTACRLCGLSIMGTGLSVGGATRLSAALAQNRSLRRLCIGQDPILMTFLMSSSSIAELVLVCSKEEAGLAEALAQMLRTNTTVRSLWLEEAHFSVGEWRCIFEALSANKTLCFLSLRISTTLDHGVIDDLLQLCSANPELDIAEIVDAPLKGSRERAKGSKGPGLFCCSCTACNTGATGGTGRLKGLIDVLSASAPAGPWTMASITREHWIAVELPLVPRSQRSKELSAMRRRVFSLMGSCATLECIELPYNDVIEEEDCEDVEALCSRLPYNPVLDVLILERNRGFGTDLGCAQLARVVSGCIRTLRRITLRYVGMKSSGLSHLVQALLATRGSTSVPMELDISHNSELGDAGAHLLGQLLSSSGPTTSASSLTSLDICDIGMGVSGALSLSFALKHNTNLRTLVVGEKGSDGSTALLLQGLISNQTLTHLHLWKGGRKPDNGLEDILVQVLQSSGTTALCNLVIEHVPFQPEEWRKIFRALEKNQVLKVLDIHKHFDLEPVFDDLMQLLQVNTTIEEINLEHTDLREKQASVQEQLRRNKEFMHDLAALPKANAKSCRVVLCGKEYAGKSTLWEAMKHLHDQRTATTAAGHGHGTAQSHYDKKHSSSGSSCHKELEKRTSGISIHMLKDEADMRIAVWDFAGHREFHALHDFMFPSANNAATLFVLAVSPILSPLEDIPAGGYEVKTPERLEDEMLYWLRFIASNSKPGATKPSVVVVLTHNDILSDPANLDPKDEVSWLSDVEKSVARLEGLFHDLLTLRPEPFIVNAVDMEDAGLKKWANDVEKTLKSKLEGLETEPEICSQVVKRLADSNSPIISTNEFAHLCKSLCEEGNMPYQEEGWKPVAAYLHDVGEVIYHPKLGFIVKNPRWFGHGVLGHMLDPFPLHNKRATGYNAVTNHRPRNGFLSKKHLSNLLEKAMQSVPSMDSKNVGVQPDDLIQLMLLLDLCYEQTPGDPKTGYLLPALFDDVDDKAANGKRPRTWRKWEAHNLIFVGRRLECVDLRRTILTDGFFPRLQVVLLRQALEKWVTPKDTSSWGLEKNLYTIRVNGMEIMLEYSGIPSYYVDILVKSSQPHSETLQFLHDNFISAIRSFCASQEGCPGVILREAIIRPACLSEPSPVLCAYRKDQAIAIEELEQRKGRYPNYSHFWSEVVEGAGSEVLPAASDSGTFLLTGEVASLELGDDCYPSTTLEEGEKRGVAVLISMEKYESGDRLGGSVDRGSLKTLAGSLGLDVNVLVDITARELKEELVRIAQEGGVLPNDDCFVCFVNAHGNTNSDGAHYILDQEGDMILLDDIMRPFTTCEHLREKPKVFFVNSCRGNNIVVDIPGSPFAGQPAYQPWNQGNETRYVKELSDCLVVFSTSGRAMSARDPVHGTCFVNALVATILLKRHTTDMLSIINSVNYAVVHEENYILDAFKDKVAIRQCPIVVHSLTKRLYFR